MFNPKGRIQNVVPTNSKSKTYQIFPADVVAFRSWVSHPPQQLAGSTVLSGLVLEEGLGRAK